MSAATRTIPLTERLDLLLREACSIDVTNPFDVSRVLVPIIVALRDLADQVEQAGDDAAAATQRPLNNRLTRLEATHQGDLRLSEILDGIDARLKRVELGGEVLP